MRRYLMGSIMLLIILTGCSGNATIEEMIDNDTIAEIAVVDNLESHMTLHHYLSDNMDRGNHEFDNKEVVIDTTYHLDDLKRGDVVFFNDDHGEKTISRVVALPGEKVSIQDGTVYIDGKLLDSFYGTVKRAGLDKETYMDEMEMSENNMEDAMEYFEMTMDEIEVGEKECFLIDDDWIRGRMVLLKSDDLLGKVIGYHE